MAEKDHKAITEVVVESSKERIMLASRHWHHYRHSPTKKFENCPYCMGVPIIKAYKRVNKSPDKEVLKMGQRESSYHYWHTKIRKIPVKRKDCLYCYGVNTILSGRYTPSEWHMLHERLQILVKACPKCYPVITRD